MPELPDLEVIQQVLNRRIRGLTITEIEVYRPLALRVLEPDLSPEQFIVGRSPEIIRRRGKFLVFELDNGTWMALNFMLAGSLRFAQPKQRSRVRDYFALRFVDGTDLRFYDPRGMGKAYFTRDLDQVPGMSELGPEPLDPALTAEVFVQRLRAYNGEIKGILTRGALVAGIGNAYADEILFAAGIYPFRKRASLSADEQLALYRAMHEVFEWATPIVRERMGEDIDQKIRDFLRVHLKKGQPCPRCGQTISEVNVSQRATNFCRHCQPGSLVRQ